MSYNPLTRSARARFQIRTPDDLTNIARNDPDALLAAMQLDCVGWKNTSVDGQRAAVRRIAGVPVQLSPIGIVTIDSWSRGVQNAIAAINGHCAVRNANNHIVAAAGQAAGPSMSAADSYFNGPTLLAAAVAFGLGYAACHYLAPLPSSPMSKRPRRR